MGSLEGISEKDEDYIRSEEQQEDKNDDILRNMLDFRDEEIKTSEFYSNFEIIKLNSSSSNSFNDLMKDDYQNNQKRIIPTKNNNIKENQ